MTERSSAPPTRWEILRDVLSFQVKLAVDALRDVFLSPVSLVAALLDVVSGDRERPYFYEVLVAGRKTEAFINLFGDAERIEPRHEATGEERRSIDRVVRRVEALVVEQYERGGVTAQAKDAIDRSLDSLASRRGGGHPPQA